MPMVAVCGLYKRRDGGAQWVYRYTLHGRRHEMGLGRFPDVSLKEAREGAEPWRAKVREGVDPIKNREDERERAARNMNLLRDIALDAFESRKAELKDDGKGGALVHAAGVACPAQAGTNAGFRKSTNAIFATRLD